MAENAQSKVVGMADEDADRDQVCHLQHHTRESCGDAVPVFASAAAGVFIVKRKGAPMNVTESKPF